MKSRRKNVKPWNTDIILKRKNVYLKNISIRHTEQSEVSINTYELSGNGFFTSFRMTIKSRRKNVYPKNTDIVLRRKNVYLKNINEDLKRKNV